MAVSGYARTAVIAHDGTMATRLAGLSIASMGPALFWASALAAFDVMFDAPFTNVSIAFFGVAIAAFLAAVCGPLMLRN